MKSYTHEPTTVPGLFRVVDLSGNWTHYYHEPSNQYLRGVTFILDTGFAKSSRFLHYIKNTSPQELEEKLKFTGERGSHVHNLIDTFFALNGKVSLEKTRVWDRDAKGYVAITPQEWTGYFLPFAQFWMRHDPILLASEGSAYNLKFGYAGTFDAILILTKNCGVKTCKCDDFVGKVGIFDWKTSGGIWESYGPQMSSYAKAENLADYAPDGVNYTCAVRLGSGHVTTGGYEAEFYPAAVAREHFQDFLSAIRISNRYYKPFDAAKEIVEIPDRVSISVRTKESEEKKAKKKVARKKAAVKKTARKQKVSAKK